MMEELEGLIIPSGNNPSRGAIGGFKNKRSKRRRKEGGCKEKRDVVELRFLDAENRRAKRFNRGPKVITLATPAKAMDIPTSDREFRQHKER
jgi:hypothetical protein